MNNNRSIVLRKLEITDLQYCEMVERGGYVWLHRYFSHVPEMIEIAKYSSMFWKWWVNEWEIRDDSFLRENKTYPWPKHVQEAAYNYQHDIERVLVVPNKWVIKEVNNLIKTWEANQ